MSAISSCILRLRRHFAITPALPVLLLYASGLAGPVLEASTALRWLFLLAGLILAIAWQGRRFLLVLWLPVFGLAWGAACRSAPWQTYLRLLPRAECAAVIRAVVISNPSPAPAAASDSAASAVAPSHEVIAIQAIRLDGSWHPCRGKVLLRLPRGKSSSRSQAAPQLPILRHGDNLLMEGVFLRLPASQEEHLSSHSYGRHLRSLGIHRLFLVQKFLAVSPASGWRRPWRWFLERRGVLARLLTHGFTDSASAGMYQTMLLGGQGAMPRHLREAFVRSATIHIFSISGLHVGTILTFALAFLQSIMVPFRLRWVILMPLLGAYIILVGSAPSAARSFWMAFAVSLAIIRFRPTASTNALAFSGLVLLLVNPFFLTNLGFVYSFTLVAVLLYGWQPIGHINDALHEKVFWLPHDHQRRWRQWSGRWLVGAVGTSCLAWIGSAGLNLYCNGLLTLGAVLVNTLLIPVAWCLIMFAAPKCLAAAVYPPLSNILAKIIECLMDILTGLGQFGSQPSLAPLFPMPSFAWALLFHVLLLALRAARSRLMRWAAALGLAVCLVAATAGNRRAKPPALLICQGDDGAPPAVCLFTADSRAPTVLYPGGRSSARALITALAARGHHRVGTLYLPVANSDTRGAANIISRLSPAALVLPPKLPTRNAFLRGQIHSAHADGANLTHFALAASEPACQDGAVPLASLAASAPRRKTDSQQLQHLDGPRVYFAPTSAPVGQIGALLSYHDTRLGLRLIFERISPGLTVISWRSSGNANDAVTLEASLRPKIIWIPLG
ncbi:MAG: ComEC/Rec2 family competence protein [Lentisphaerae bacterium]|nr:ComEC/Rec2 family competence protein [Lentisphaerota bacterium]